MHSISGWHSVVNPARILPGQGFGLCAELTSFRKRRDAGVLAKGRGPFLIFHGGELWQWRQDCSFHDSEPSAFRVMTFLSSQY